VLETNALVRLIAFSMTKLLCSDSTSFSDWTAKKFLGKFLPHLSHFGKRDIATAIKMAR